MSELKNVVVVGLGIGGVVVAKALAAQLPKTHRVVGISENDFAYYPVASLRAATVPDKGYRSRRRALPKGSRHVVLSGTKVLSISAHSVAIDVVHDGFGLEIPFDSLIIATGSTYAFPARPATGVHSEVEVAATLKAFQADIASASSLLVVGGGATGIELAGEVAAQYPGKAITLVHSGAQLFETGYKKSLGPSLDKQLKALGVKIVYGAKVNTAGLDSGKVAKQEFVLSNGSSVQADFIFKAYGCIPNSALVKAFDASLVNAAGFIKVKPTLQLASQDGSLDHIFALGDCNDVAETKLIAFAKWQVPTLTANVVALTSGSKAPLKVHKPAGLLTIVTVGPSGGAGQLFGFVIGAWLSSRIKSSKMFQPQFVDEYRTIKA